MLNVSSVEQIRRKRSARLKGMAFLVCRDGNKNKVDAGVCRSALYIGQYKCYRR